MSDRQRVEVGRIFPSGMKVASDAWRDELGSYWIEAKCPDGHLVTMRLSGLYRNQRCPLCRKEEAQRNKRKAKQLRERRMDYYRRLKRAVKLVAKGVPISQAAKQTSLSYSLVRNAAKKRSSSVSHTYRGADEYSEIRHKMAQDLAECGWSVHRIGSVLGISPQRVSQIRLGSDRKLTRD